MKRKKNLRKAFIFQENAQFFYRFIFEKHFWANEKAAFRSGSSMLGTLFDKNPNLIYYFEPLTGFNVPNGKISNDCNFFRLILLLTFFSARNANQSSRTSVQLRNSAKISKNFARNKIAAQLRRKFKIGELPVETILVRICRSVVRLFAILP